MVGIDFAGVDITKEPIRIKPGNHYTMGGVKTDVNGRTDVPGLYAAGEVACVSVHGGNRLGANSLLDTPDLRPPLRPGRRRARQGPRALEPLAEDPRRRGGPPAARSSPATRGRGRRVSEVRKELGETMDKHVAVFRDEAGIKTALETVQRLKEEAESCYIDDRGTVFNQDVLGALELGYMLDNAEATCVGALHRTESRGAQYRTDFPDRNDDEWLKHIDLSMNGGAEPEISYSDVTMTQWEPKERTY